MSVYLIAQVEIIDRQQYKQYIKGCLSLPGTIDVVVADESPIVLEGEWPANRTVVFRFPTEEDAMRWYRSPEYQAVAQHRVKSARTNLILAKGFTPPT